MDRRTGRRRDPRRLGCRRGQGRAPIGRPVPPVPEDPGRRPAHQPHLRDGQPVQAGHRPRPVHRRGACRAHGPAGRRRRVHLQPADRRAGPPRPRSGDPLRALPAARLLPGDRLRLRGRGRRPGRLRRGRLLGPLRRGRPAHPARQRSPFPAGRHGRPSHRHVSRRGHLGGPVRPGAHRGRPGGRDVPHAPGRLHGQLRPEPHAYVGLGHGRGRPDLYGQPGHEQLPGGLRASVLDRRP